LFLINWIEAKKEPDFVITCTHCLTDDYKLEDVDLKAPVKHYTDTPFKFASPEKRTHDRIVTPARLLESTPISKYPPLINGDTEQAILSGITEHNEDK